MRRDRILLVAKRNGRWALPGGRRKPGEALSQAAVRELSEETRLTAHRVDYLFQFWGFNTQHFVFSAHVSPDLEAKPANETACCKWVKLCDVKRLPASVSTKGIAEYPVRARVPLFQRGPIDAHDISHEAGSSSVCRTRFSPDEPPADRLRDWHRCSSDS
ncbi:NUDIX hydrolase [Caballeronia sp. S22]|uniref:NUDIX hydrolase n=1 Tax=Caballeronia sp. S22 TaxID=3137182 RepID=UPI0035306971